MKRLLSLAFFCALVSTSLPAAAQTANAAAYLNAGSQFYAAKDYAKAASYYKYATQLDPANADGFYRLGNAYYLLGQKPEALAAYQQAKNLNPNLTQVDPYIKYLQTQVSSASPLTSSATTGNNPVASKASADKKLQITVNAGAAVGTNTGYGVGFGGGAGALYLLDRNLGLGVDAGFYTFGLGSSSGSGGGVTISSSASASFLELAACGKYIMDGDNIHPFLFGGVGIADCISSQSASASGSINASASASSSQMNPLIVLGGGLGFPAGQNMDFFARVKVSIIMVPGTPVTINGSGATTNVGGGTLMYIPVEAGLAFNM